jgi:hypothetical protein
MRRRRSVALRAVLVSSLIARLKSAPFVRLRAGPSSGAQGGAVGEPSTPNHRGLSTTPRCAGFPSRRLKRNLARSTGGLATRSTPGGHLWGLVRLPTSAAGGGFADRAVRIYVVDSSCFLVGAATLFCPGFGRYCSQVVPNFFENHSLQNCALNSAGHKAPGTSRSPTHPRRDASRT